MKYLYELVDLLNQYDGSNREMENRIRDLVCYISDSSEYMQIDLYRSIVFEAAQKLRMFGYIKGTNRIAQDEFFYDNLNDIKHSAIQNYYKSKVFSNNLLDKRQKEVIDKFMSLEQKRILVSAPTSFGKTFLLREIIFLNRERYRNILLLFPTIALLNENTESVNQLIQELKLEYKIINNVYSGIEDTEKHIFILTPERALKLLADNANLSIDFFFFDEVYKIDEDFDRNEDSNEKEGEEEYEEFDPFLYSMLVDARDAMLGILQDREHSLKIRVGLILGMAHDLQGRFNREQLFSCEEVIERYQTKSARKFVRKLWKEEKPSVQERWEMAHKMFRELYELELLREDWDMLLMESEELLYSHGADAYKGISSDFKRWAKEESNIQIQAEQLLVYFIFTYFCGAVYDGRIYAKVQMAVISTFHIYELWKARWIKNEGELTPEEIVELVYRYSREIEHSDKNLERMEKMMLRDRLPWYRG